MSEFIVPAVELKKIDKIGLIDADYIKYFVMHHFKGEAHEISQHTEDALKYLNGSFRAKGLLFCFSGDYVFRRNLGFEKRYKGNRNKSDDANMAILMIKKMVEKYISDRYLTLKFSGLEADDIISMLQAKDTFVYSDDKDLLQVPGTHWNIKKKEWYEISEEEAFRNLMKQMLIGDSVDNIGGLKGFGPVACDKFLTNRQNVGMMDLFLDVIEEYQKTHHDNVHAIDAFVENWNLLKLRLDRGAHFKEQYKEAFNTLNLLRE